MKIFWSYYHENILKTSVLLWAPKSLSFILNNNSVEKKINIQQILLFSFVKNKPKTSKKVISICSLIMVLIKMRLLIFLVLSRYGSACKYGIIFQTSIHNWIQNWFSDTWNNNCQSGKAKRDTWFSSLFKKKIFFLIEYVLKIK